MGRRTGSIPIILVEEATDTTTKGAGFSDSVSREGVIIPSYAGWSAQLDGLVVHFHTHIQVVVRYMSSFG